MWYAFRRQDSKEGRGEDSEDGEDVQGQEESSKL